jgi:hypothetical protein
MPATITYDGNIFPVDKILYIQKEVHEDGRRYSMVCLAGGARMFVEYMDDERFRNFEEIMNTRGRCITYDEVILPVDKILYVKKDVREEGRTYSMISLDGDVHVHVGHMNDMIFRDFDRYMTSD